jgi:hypothetical protein
MNAERQPDGSLLLTYDSSVWSKWAIGITMLLLATAGYDYFIGTRGDERLIGLLAGAATTALTALVILEQARFRLDPITRLIEWDQRWGFRRRSGILKFADVQHVSVEVPIGDDGVPSRRIVFHLSNGTLLPLTVGYRPDTDNGIINAAQTIRGVLGQAPPTTAESVRALLAQGKKIDAIKLLVEREGLSLAEAKQRIDESDRTPS